VRIGRRRSGPAKRYLKYAFYSPDWPTSYLEGAGKELPSTTVLSEGTNEVVFSRPERTPDRGEIVCDIESQVLEAYPRDQNVASKIKQHCWPSRYGVTFITRSLSREGYLHFTLPNSWQTLEAFWRGRGYSIARSRIGEASWAVLRLVGSEGAMDQLRSELVFRILEQLSLKSSKKLAQRIVKELGRSPEDIPGIESLLQKAELIQDVRRDPRSVKQLRDQFSVNIRELLPLIGKMSNLGIVQRGLYLECPSCGTWSWYAIRLLGEQVTCSGCARRFHLPVEQSAGSEIEWTYTLNALVNRLMDQDGLPAVLAISHLWESARGEGWFDFGVELHQSDKVQTDLDFIWVSHRDVSVGECKTGSALGEKDFRNAKLLAGHGLAKYYFCTVQSFNPATLDQIERLQSEIRAAGQRTEIEVLDERQLLRKIPQGRTTPS